MVICRQCGTVCKSQRGLLIHLSRNAICRKCEHAELQLEEEEYKRLNEIKGLQGSQLPSGTE